MGKIYSKNDTKIKAKVGERFSISLESIPGAGYQWGAEVDDASLKVVEKKLDPAAPDTIGGGSNDVFTFEPSQKGTSTIRLTYKRPWESSGEETVEIDVEVGDK